MHRTYYSCFWNFLVEMIQSILFATNSEAPDTSATRESLSEMLIYGPSPRPTEPDKLFQLTLEKDSPFPDGHFENTPWCVCHLFHGTRSMATE